MQEGLSNVARHSGASAVTVSLSRRDGNLLLSVKDDGRGFAAGRSAEEQLRSRTGILGMRERVAPLGGTVELADSEDGALLVIRLPLAADTAPGPSDADERVGGP